MTEHIVTTTSGKVQGYERDGRIEYLGIPYAEAPVGPLRFKRAVPKTPWEGVFDAKEYGPAPIQYNNGQVMGDEDCLTINVQVPAAAVSAVDAPNTADAANIPDTANAAAAQDTVDVAGGSADSSKRSGKLPVFIWIYGGGYNTGYSSDEMYRGDAFVKDGVLFFSFNYRTNILGFYDFTTYPGCEDFDSNCGLSDQILAINWIHDNVEAFGGDPDRITIAGESAGGASVVNMLVCPGVKGCFQQAIIESALPNCVTTHEGARRNIDLFLEGMHWSEKDMAEHLRRDDPRLFLFGHEYVTAKHQYRNPGCFLPSPVQDDLLPVRPIDALRAGAAKDIKVIIGTNMHEGTMFVHPENTGFPNNWTMVAQMMEKNGNADALPRIIGFYHKAGRDYFSLFQGETSVSLSSSLPSFHGDIRQIGGDAFIRFATDYAFEMPAIKVAMAQKLYTDNIWMYRYELVTKSGQESGWKASHAFELPAVFIRPDHPFTHFAFDGEPKAVFDQIASEMHGDWVRFIKTGDPNPDWTRFEGANSPVRIYDRQTRTEQLDRRHLMQIWGDMRFYEA